MCRLLTNQESRGAVVSSRQDSSAALTLIVTGASGVLGRAIVPLLAEYGVKVLLVGRNPKRLGSLFPSLEVRGYDDWTCAAAKADGLIHLAVRNNSVGGTLNEFRATNRELAVRTAHEAAAAGIPAFVNLSSTLALQPWNHSPYATSKREAAERLSSVAQIATFQLYLPYVVDPGDLPGKLRWLRYLPTVVSQIAFELAAAFKPTVDPRDVARFIVSGRWRAGGELVLSRGQTRNRVYWTLARLTDIAFALGVILGLWWLLLLIAVAVRVDSPGPIIFSQPRVGRGRKIFTCYKFRTMKLGTPHLGTHEVSAASVTRPGRFLRQFKLDELPQVWNLLRGELSLVGPRPCLHSQEALIQAREKVGVFDINPGITGLAQVLGVDMSDPEQLARLDARYAGMQSLVLDWRILFETARGRGYDDRVRQ